MWTLTSDVWELVARAVAVYAFLLLIVRLSGKRTVGQFTPFDLLVVMLISESVSNSLSGSEESVTGGWIVAGTLVALNLVIGWAASRSRAIEHAVEGRPVLVGRDGEFFLDVLRRQRVGLADMEQALRSADCAQRDMKCAFLEADGNISILKNGI